MTKKTIYIRFYGGIDPDRVGALVNTVEQAVTGGVQRIVLLMSSWGGGTWPGFTAYNYLRGIPAEVVTHNIGVVQSMALAMYCAGTERLSVAHGTFLLHGTTWTFPSNVAQEEKQIVEAFNSLKSDTNNLGSIISANTGQTLGKVLEDMHERTVMNAEEAVSYGLAHRIDEGLFPLGATLISIG